MSNSFLQREKRMKRYNRLLFSVKEQGLENRKLRKLFGVLAFDGYYFSCKIIKKLIFWILGFDAFFMILLFMLPSDWVDHTFCCCGSIWIIFHAILELKNHNVYGSIYVVMLFFFLLFFYNFVWDIFRQTRVSLFERGSNLDSP